MNNLESARAAVHFDMLVSGLGFVEGPVALPDGQLVVASITDGALYRIDSSGNVVSRIAVGGGPNGIAADVDGALYVAQNGGIWGGKAGCGASIQRVIGDTVETLVEGLGAPNDLCIGPDGRLYFTDPLCESDPANSATATPGRLYSCSMDGRDLKLLAEGPFFINGLAFSSDANSLYVVETGHPHRVLAYEFRNGDVGDGTEMFRLDAGFPDGIAVDSDGSIWVATTSADQVMVYAESGKREHAYQCPAGALPTNLCFGISRPEELYVTASGIGAVLRAQTASQGLGLYQSR